MEAVMRKISFVLLVLCTVLGLQRMAGAQTKSLSSVFHVQLGDEQALQGIEINRFFPSDLVVNVGDSIVFTQVTHEPHTVTFNAPTVIPEAILVQPDHSLVENQQVVLPSPAPQGPPLPPDTPIHLSVGFDGSGYVNSGFLMAPGDSFSITFTRSGSYPYVCLIHAKSMKGTITVNPSGTVRPKSDEQYAMEAAEQMKQYRLLAEQERTAVLVPGPTQGAYGARTYTVLAGVEGQQGIDFTSFFGGTDLVVRSGDTVSWTMSRDMAGMPHTVTFLSGGEEPPFILPQPEPNGPPTLLVNPKIAEPSPTGQAAYFGTGFFNSGLMVAKSPTPQEWSVKFEKPGVYHYFCVLHDEEGMQGNIIVTP
jgi:plastocyanin